MTDARRLTVVKPTIPVDPTEDANPFFGGVPENVLDSEGIYLSRLLTHPDSYSPLGGLLEPHHFYATANQRVFQAIRAVQEKLGSYDVTLVAQWMREHGTLTQVGGTPYLAQFAEDGLHSGNAVSLHALEILEAWKRRELLACMGREAIKLRAGGSHAAAYQELKAHFQECKP